MEYALKPWQVENLQKAGAKPMNLNHDRKCKGGTTRVSPKRVRTECQGCMRLRPYAEDAGPDDIDPVGAWVDSTAQRSGYCRERIAVLTTAQVEAMDETAGIAHPQTVGANASRRAP